MEGFPQVPGGPPTGPPRFPAGAIGPDGTFQAQQPSAADMQQLMIARQKYQRGEGPPPPQHLVRVGY